MNAGILLGIVGLVVGVLGILATLFIGPVSDEVQGWLDIAPRAILRLAGARLNREQRERLYHEEWLPELQFIMQEAETRPITRAIRAISFALGLLMAARAVARLRPSEPRPAVAEGAHPAGMEGGVGETVQEIYLINPEKLYKHGMDTVRVAKRKKRKKAKKNRR